MSNSEVIAQVIGNEIRCTITTSSEKCLVISGTLECTSPTLSGSEELKRNQALISNAWSYAKTTAIAVQAPTKEEQESARKSAKSHQSIAVWIADYVTDLSDDTRTGWCSSCITYSDHRKVRRPVGVILTWLCETCGSPTVVCLIPKCNNMASKNRKPGSDRKYCAEHRHEIPSFVRAGQPIESLTDYKEFMAYAKPNFSRSTKVIGFGAAGALIFWPLAVVAAPAIGGAVGGLVGGYSGAAATSFGLAWLGGGSIAAGGLGMAGGTAVVTALGTALGGGVSASIASAYVGEDKSFHIEMLKGGTGTPVVVCNGFLTEEGKGWAEWKRIVTSRYPDSPVYRVHWGAKELKDIGFVTRNGAVKGSLPLIAQQLAARSGKVAARKLGPLSPLLAMTELAKNPWYVAKNRADKTGVILADLLARTLDGPFILAGHSLGARVMTVAAQTLGMKYGAAQVQSLHLLGNAINSKGDWEPLTRAVDGMVYNYFSRNDSVLKFIYSVAQVGQTAAGYAGFKIPERVRTKVQNIDTTEYVDGHSAYQSRVELR